MTKSHNQLLRRQHPQCTRFRFIRCLERSNKLHHRFVRSAVQVAAQRTDTCRNARIVIRHRGCSHPGGEGGGVEFMLGIKRQRNIENLDGQLISRTSMKQMEKVARYALISRYGLNALSPCYGSDTSTAASVRLAQAAVGNIRCRPLSRLRLQRPKQGAACLKNFHRVCIGGKKL